MKICIVGTSLSKGGAERSMAMLSEMLSTMGFDVHLVVLNDQIDYSCSGVIFNLGKYKNKSNDSLLKRILRFRKLRQYLKRQNFNYIIDHRPKNDYYREVFYSKYVYKGFRKIYVVHSANQTLIAEGKHELFVKIHRDTYANVAVSRYIENDILNAHGLSNTRTIYNTFDPKWNTPKYTSGDPLDGKNYILSYGRIVDSVKDFKFLIDAFSASELWKRNIFLVILGDGKDKESLESYKNTVKGSQFILFHPFTDNPFPYIYNSKFVTLTSKYEGFPMVLLETLSIGVPVVALDIKSGPNEIIKHEENGLLVSLRKRTNFANAMIKMFDNKALYNYCKSNAKSSIEHFSKNHISQEWEQLLKDE